VLRHGPSPDVAYDQHLNHDIRPGSNLPGRRSSISKIIDLAGFIVLMFALKPILLMFALKPFMACCQ
jgi:hypothetical protein